MVDIVSIGLVALGAVIMFAGAVLARYGVALLGVVVGGGGGWLLAPELGLAGTEEIAAAVLVGAVAGVVITYLVLSIAISMLAFAVGSYVGAGVAEWVLDDPELALVVVAGLAAGAVAAFLGTIFKRTVMIFITAIMGAALASRAVTPDDIGDGDVFFSLGEPIFLGLFALGVLTQFGLFKFSYVTTIVSKLPGAGMLRDRDDDSE